MQLAITFALVAAAGSYTAYSLWRSIYPAKGGSADCSSGCGKCAMNPVRNEKGEPVTLVPLQIVSKP